MSEPERLTDAIMAAIAEDIQCGIMLSDARVRRKVLAILHAEASPAPQADTVMIPRHIYGDLLYAQGELASIEALVSERREVGIYAKVEAVLREASPAPSPAGAALERLVDHLDKWVNISRLQTFSSREEFRQQTDHLLAVLRAAPSPAAEKNKPMTGAEQIVAERQRQIDTEGWTSEHDDAHESGELIAAAIKYADAAYPNDWYIYAMWPWSDSWWKPSEDPIRNLVKAGALIAAEIDRLTRVSAPQGAREQEA